MSWDRGLLNFETHLSFVKDRISNGMGVRGDCPPLGDDLTADQKTAFRVLWDLLQMPDLVRLVTTDRECHDLFKKALRLIADKLENRP